MSNAWEEWVLENWEELREIEKKHSMQIAKTQTPQYLVDTFPEEQALVMQKLREYWHEAKKTYRQLQEIRQRVDRTQSDTFSKWFFMKKNTFEEGKRLMWLKEQITQLERLKIIYEKKRLEKNLSKEFFKTKKERERFDIDRMFSRKGLLLDIVNIEGITLKKNGSLYKGLCPFHTEQTPSFFVYADNWYHCFGCNEHGNFIDFLMKRKGLSFRQALEEANSFI